MAAAGVALEVAWAAAGAAVTAGAGEMTAAVTEAVRKAVEAVCGDVPMALWVGTMVAVGKGSMAAVAAWAVALSGTEALAATMARRRPVEATLVWEGGERAVDMKAEARSVARVAGGLAASAGGSLR